METSNLIGELVDKRFKIISQLGAGGFGAVYLADQQDMNRKVALKFVHVSASDDPELLARFEREGRIIAALDHKNIVRCYSYGLWRNKVPYLALEYLEGSTLRQLRENDSISWQKAFEYGIEICSALTELHSHNIVHRDLKPENIIVTSDGTLKLIDFGLVSIDGQKLTKTGKVVGSLLYLSPEQAYGAAAVPGSDLYSLGCVLYQLISGKPPFYSPVPLEILRLHAAEEPLELRPSLPELPKGVDRILRHALQKDASNRYSSAADFADDMRALLQNETLISAPVVVASIPMAPSKVKAILGAVVSAVLVIGFIALGAGYYQSNAGLQTEADKLSASIDDELQKSGLSDRGPYGKTYQFVGLEDLPDQSQLNESTRGLCTRQSVWQKQSEIRLANSSERYAHLDKAIALISNPNVSNDDRAAVLLTESYSWKEKYLSTARAVRWIDEARKVLSKPIQPPSLRQKLISANDDLVLYFEASVFYGIKHLLYDPIQNPGKKPRMFAAATRLENLLLPIVGQLNPDEDPVDPKRTSALSDYSVFLSGTGQSDKAIQLLQPYINSARVSDKNKAIIIQALVIARVASGDLDAAFKDLRESQALAHRLHNEKLWNSDFILLLVANAKETQRKQLALDALDVGVTLPLDTIVMNHLKAEKVTLLAAEKQTVRAIEELNGIDNVILQNTHYSAANLALSLADYFQIVRSFDEMGNQKEAISCAEKLLPLSKGTTEEPLYCRVLADVYLQQKRPDQAAILLKRGMDITAQTPSERWWFCSTLLNSLISRQQWNQADGMYACALEITAASDKPAQGLQYIWMAEKYELVPGKSRYATDCLKRALDAASGNEAYEQQVHELLFSHYARTNNIELAMKELSLSQAPGAAPLSEFERLMYLSNSLMDGKHVAESVSLRDGAIDLAKTKEEKLRVWYRQSYALITLKRYKDAEPLLREALAVNPADPRILYASSLFMFETGQKQQCRSLFQSLLKTPAADNFVIAVKKEHPNMYQYLASQGEIHRR